jgi:uncharacterized protein
VPIEFDDQRVDVSNVDDRRGGGGGGMTGIIGIIVFILFQLLGGGGSGGGNLPIVPVDTAPQAQAGGAVESSQQLSDRCNASGALTKYTDCRLIKSFTVADTVWKDEFARRGVAYNSPKIAFFTSRTQTGCGPASAEVGPFYCPADQEIYFELGFLDQLQQQFGAQGDFAQAYIVAHEFGHHMQSLLGIEPKVRAAQERRPSAANQYSVALELQADCFAGAWSTLADKSTTNGIHLTQQNIAEAQNAAGAVGDDRIQAKVQGRVTPESFTHGTAAQRLQWFNTGNASGSLDSCDTFKYYNLSA